MDEDLTLFLEDFVDMLNGYEAAITRMKQQISKLVEIKNSQNWNPAKIKWEKAQGAKGEFEKSEDMDNSDFKALIKDLAAHDGKLSRDGYFYWLYRNGATVGRKKKEA
ncbi:MAG: hypothetical protein ACPLKZ_00985 [Candidatus Bathyarchaeales archaeon]